MRRKIFHVSLMSALLAATLAFAGGYQNTGALPSEKTKKAQVKPFEPGYEARKNEMNQGYSYPGRINVEGDWNFTIAGSFLYWQMFQEGLDYAYYYNTTAQTYEKVEWDFKYKPAFKVMVGMFFQNHDDWQLFFEYIRHHSTNNFAVNRKLGTNDVLRFSDWIVASTSANFESTSAQLKNETDILNLSLGRYFYLGTHLVLNPFFGLRGNWIDDKLDITSIEITAAQTLTTIPAHFKEDSWSVGPRTGFEAKYFLGENFRFYGNGAVSLVYHKTKVRGQITTVSGPILSYYQKDHILRPELELGLGFGWGTYFDNFNWHLDLSAGYDFVLFFNQQNISTQHFEVFNAEVLANDMYLHGLTVTATFDF